MSESEWTKLVKIALMNKGKQLGYDTYLSEKNTSLKIGTERIDLRPDVVWHKDNDFKIIFEIDTGARDLYQKTIYGSILSGILLAKQKKSKFVEVVPISQNSIKAKIISQIMKSEFNYLPPFYIIEIGRIGGKYSKQNIHKSLTIKLKKNKIIP